eukprot:1665434-Prymnesium_polylepis.1
MAWRARGAMLRRGVARASQGRAGGLAGTCSRSRAIRSRISCSSASVRACTQPGGTREAIGSIKRHSG